MRIATPERTTSQTASGSDDLDHIVCEQCCRQLCDGALCLDELDDYFEGPNDCLVCEDLDDSCIVCPHCGSP